MARNIRALPPPTPYDTLRAQYPALRTLNAVGWRLTQLLPAEDRAGVETIVRVGGAVWRLLDRALADLGPALAADALVGLAGLADAWLALRQAAILTLAPSNARQTLSLSPEALRTLARVERELTDALERPAALQLDRATTIITGLAARAV